MQMGTVDSDGNKGSTGDHDHDAIGIGSHNAAP